MIRGTAIEQATTASGATHLYRFRQLRLDKRLDSRSKRLAIPDDAATIALDKAATVTLRMERRFVGLLVIQTVLLTVLLTVLSGALDDAAAMIAFSTLTPYLYTDSALSVSINCCAVRPE